MKSSLLFAGMFCLVQIVSSQSHLAFQGKPIEYSEKQLDQKFAAYQIVECNVLSYSSALGSETLLLDIAWQEGQFQVPLLLAEVASKDVLIRISDEEGVHTLPYVPYYLYEGKSNHSSLTVCGSYLAGVLEITHDEKWYIEPLSAFVEDSDENQYILYQSKDITGENASYTCLHDDIEEKKETLPDYTNQRRALSGSLQDSFYCREVELAIAIDHTFHAAYPGGFLLPHSVLRVLTYYNVMQSRYDGIGTMGINFKINEWFISTCASCTPWNPTFGEVSAFNYYVPQFSSWVQSSNAFQRNYDIPCAWTHRKLYRYMPDYNQYWGLGGVAGGDACIGQAIISDTSNLGIDHIGSRFAHEVGHTLGYQHDTVGMNWIMSPSVSDTTVLFSPESIDFFYRNLKGKNCLNDCNDEHAMCMDEESEENIEVSCAMSWQWAKSAGSENDDASNAIVVQGEQLYITGYHADSATFDQGIWLTNGSGCLESNMFLAKYNTSGLFQEATNDLYRPCQFDNPPIAPYTYRSEGLDLGLGCQDEIAISGYTYRNIFTDEDFYVNVWSENHDLNGLNYNYNELQITTAVTVNSYGKVISAGYYEDQMRLENYYLENNGNYDGYVFIGNKKGSTDIDGAIIKIGQHGNQTDVVNDVEVDGDDNIYFTGYFSGMAKLLDDYGNELAIFSMGDKDAYIAKSDSKGELQWAKTLGGIGDDEGVALSVNSSGDIYVVGTYMGSITSGGMDYASSMGEKDAFIAKYSTDGVFQWIRYGTGSGEDLANDVDCSDDRIYVAGSYELDIQFSNNVNDQSVGGKDVYVVVYNENGDVVDSKTVGGPGDDEGLGLAVDEYKSVYLTGSYENTVQFGEDQLISRGGKDIFTAKLYSKLLMKNKIGSASCGASDGYINISIQQGLAPFSIQWESIPGGAITGNTVLNSYASYNIQNVPSGMYRITVSEPGRCYTEELIVEVEDDCCMASHFGYSNTNSIRDCYEVDFTDESTTSTGTPVTFWHWTFGDGNTSSAQNPTHIYSSAGTYSVCLATCTFGCCDVFCNEVIVEGCGLGPWIPPNKVMNKREEMEKSNAYQVYPNPTEGLLYINWGDNETEEKKVIVQLYNQLGQEMIQQELSYSQKSIDISSISTGVYFLQIREGGKETYFQKVTKK